MFMFIQFVENRRVWNMQYSALQKAGLIRYDCNVCEQEAQLSQRDRARFLSLNILLSHSRSLKVIRNETVE